MKILKADLLAEPDYVQNRVKSLTVELEDHDALFLLIALEGHPQSSGDPNINRLKEILKSVVR
jgi:hypothetical protein